MQHIRDKGRVYLLADIQFQSLIAQFFTGYNFLRQCIRIGDDAQALLPFLQTAQYFRAENLICRIFLPVLNGTAERRRKEKYSFCPQHLRQVVIKIPRFLQIAQNKDKRTTSLLHQYRRKKRSSRRI